MSATRLSEKPSASRSRKGAATRERLLDAAKAVFRDVGFLDARVSDIAQYAGMSHGSFYHYFDSKEQVFREVAGIIGEELAAGMAVIFDRRSRATPRERLSRALRLHFEVYRTEARMMGVIEHVSRHDHQVFEMLDERRRVQVQRVAESIARLQRLGMADPALDPEMAAAALGAMTWRFAEQWLVNGQPDIDFDAGVEGFARLFANALQLPDDPEVHDR